MRHCVNNVKNCLPCQRWRQLGSWVNEQNFFEKLGVDGEIHGQLQRLSYRRQASREKTSWLSCQWGGEDFTVASKKNNNISDSLILSFRCSSWVSNQLVRHLVAVGKPHTKREGKERHESKHLVIVTDFRRVKILVGYNSFVFYFRILFSNDFYIFCSIDRKVWNGTFFFYYCKWTVLMKLSLYTLSSVNKFKKMNYVLFICVNEEPFKQIVKILKIENKCLIS